MKPTPFAALFGFALLLCLTVFLPALAWGATATNPDGAFVIGDWDGTADNDDYTNSGIITSDFDMQQGGNDTITNTSTGVVIDDLYGSSDGSNVITNAGEVGDNVAGSYNDASTDTGGDNTITNSGTVYGKMVGSRNDANNSSGGSNTITNSGTVDDAVYGSQNDGDDSSGGENTITITSSGDVNDEIAGSRNLGANTTGGSNVIENSGEVDYISASLNVGDSSSGGNNTVTNTSTGTVTNEFYGTYNFASNSSGGSNTMTNDGAVNHNFHGSDNFADNTSGGSNTLVNNGTVTNDFEGSNNNGANSSGGSNTMTNNGTVSDDFTGSTNDGANSTGGSNVLTNNGTVSDNFRGSDNSEISASGGNNTMTNNGTVGNDYIGTLNRAPSASGGDNQLTNTGTVSGDMYGSVNAQDDNSGSNNTLTNSGTVEGNMVGSYNLGDNSSGGNNTLINSGTVTGDMYGSRTTGTGASDSANTITNSGTVDGNIITGENGDDTVTNSGTVGVDITTGAGADTVNNTGNVNNSIDTGDGADNVTNTGVVANAITTGAGNDTVNNSNTAGSISTGDGDDTIANIGVVNNDINAGDGNNTVSSTYSVANITTGAGADQVTTSGTVNGAVNTGAGNDTITNSGAITGDLNAGAGDDVVTINQNSNIVGATNGGDGTDTLNFSNAGDQNGAQITGFESFNVYGDSNSLSGDTTIDGDSTVHGALDLQGTLTTTLLTLNSGASLTGPGTLNGGLDTSGTLSPGNSIGTLTINGDLTFRSGSKLIIELFSDGTSDQIITSGDISILGGDLDISFENLLVSRSTTWTIIDGDGAISGAFDSVTNFSSATLELITTIDQANADYQITLKRALDYSDIGQNAGQVAMGGVLDSIIPGASGDWAELFMDMDFTYSENEIRYAMEQMLPRMYFGVLDAGLETSRTLDNALLSRSAAQRDQAFFNALAGVAPEFTPGLSIWTKALGAWSDHQAQDEHLGYDFNIVGTALGVDAMPLPWLTLGVDVALTQNSLGWSEGDYSGQQHGKHVGVFAAAHLEGFRLQGATRYSDFSTEYNRPISFGAGKYNYTAKGDIHSSALLARATAGYDITLGNLLFGPELSFTHIALSQEQFTEEGADFLNLTVQNVSTHSSSSTVGAHAAYLLSLPVVDLLTRVNAGWRHEFNDQRQSLDAHFISYAHAPFSVTGAERQTDSFLLGAGVTALAGEHFTASLEYGLDHGGKSTAHDVSFSLGVRF